MLGGTEHSEDFGTCLGCQGWLGAVRAGTVLGAVYPQKLAGSEVATDTDPGVADTCQDAEGRGMLIW